MGLRSGPHPRGLKTALFGGLLAAFIGPGALAALSAPEAQVLFRQANELARSGDYPKALDAYRELSEAGAEGPSLYWNWAQAASARGSQGEALWALLRAHDLDPGDLAVTREIERVREALNLDRAEVAPEPLSAAARFARRFRLDLVAAALFGLSVLLHLTARLAVGGRGGVAASVALGLGLLTAAAPIAGSFARPTAVVVRRGAPLLDQASPTAEAVGTLREGEVVPILDASGEYFRIEDSSGARGWAVGSDVRRLDRPQTP